MLKDIQLPKKLDFLLDKPARYKSAKGGRGSAKSWSFAAALLIRGTLKPQRFLCCREFQKSLKDSVYQLLSDLIKKWEMEEFYDVQASGIIGKNGTVFGFEGLRHNITNIKSWEGADVAWVEEAQTMSKVSWDVLPPTIRKDGSELWFSWNPDLEDDETWQRLVVNPPEDLIQVTMNYNDNPWFPPVLEQERQDMKRKDPVSYDNIWEGNPRQAIEGAIFAKELQAAAEDKRICHVPHDPVKPVDTFWDLGHSDQTSIWFVQKIGFEYRILRHYANSREKMQHYLEYVTKLPYVYGTHFLPHDARHEQLGQERTIEQQAMEILKNVQVIPRTPKKINAIEAARSIFPMCYFDKELCADGLTALRRYAYKVDLETGKTSKEPEHNLWSHAADSFMAIGQASEVTSYNVKVPTSLHRITIPQQRDVYQ